jgi:hypothetical protein
MKTITKPHTHLPPPPRTDWSYDNYFLEQLAKIKNKAEAANCKIANT